MRQFISTAHSIGNSFTIGSMQPMTIIAAASFSNSPRLMRSKTCSEPTLYLSGIGCETAEGPTNPD